MAVPLAAIFSLVATCSVEPMAAQASSVHAWGAVSRRVRELVQSGDVAGVGLRIARGRKTVYDRAFGKWSIQETAPVASSTKIASAAVIMSLVDAGKLSLKTKVVSILPWFDATDQEKSSITLGELLSHTSGLPGLGSSVPCLADTTTTLAACVHQIAKGPMQYKPGAGFAYGGADFQVAGLMAQRVTHEPFVDLFRQRLARPCHLNWQWNSKTNPRVAGGGETDSASMLRVLSIQETGGLCGNHRVLSPNATSRMRADFTAGKPILYTPGLGSRTYGLGLWRDVVTSKDVATAVSSPGALGSYPWVDLRHGYRAYLSMVSSSSNAVEESNATVHDLRPLIDKALGGPSRNDAAPDPIRPWPLSARSLMAGVRAYAAEPDHLSGTVRGASELNRIGDELRADGLSLHRQAYTFPRFVPTRLGLTAGGFAVPRRAVAPMLYSGTTGVDGVSASLFDGGDGTFDPAAASGKIVVARIAYAGNALAVHLDAAISAAVQGGAKALVAVTDAVGNYPKWEDVNARGGTGPLPVLMVGKHSGARVIGAAENGLRGRLTLEARTGTACAADLWGALEGKAPGRRVIVGTPTSSFVPAASERGSGVAVLEGLARYYSGVPRRLRPETLDFLATTGHEVGLLGLPALLRSHARWFRRADAYVHLGASLGAPTATELPSGRIQVTPSPDPTGSLYDSENPLLDQAIPAAFARSGVDLRDTQPHVHIVGEQAYAYHVGVPLVSFSGASLFFHTAGDLPSTVDPQLLAEEADGFRRSIDAITAMAPGALRSANTQAQAYGAAMNPNPSLQAGQKPGPGPHPVARCRRQGAAGGKGER